MEQISELVRIDREEELEAAYDDLDNLTEDTLYALLDGLIAEFDAFPYMDDVEFHTIDCDESDRKEIVSGDGHLVVAEEEAFGETINEYDIQYEVHRGHDGSNDGEPIYNPVEVSIIFK